MRGLESRTSLLVLHTEANFLALENGKETRAPIFILTDSAINLPEKEEWVGPGKHPTLYSSKNEDIVCGILELPQHRVRIGFLTPLLKIQRHRGEPFKEAIDWMANTAIHAEGVPLLWKFPSARIIYVFVPNCSEPEETPYTAPMNDTLQKLINTQAATSSLYSTHSPGVTSSFL